MDTTWIVKTEELKRLREEVSLSGGEDKTNKQHSAGKLTSRERIDILCDKGTFVELNDMMSSRTSDFGMDEKKRLGDGVITGYGKINGRLVFVSSQDFTVCGGSLGEAHARKICKIIDKAIDAKAPIIFLNDSGGARIEEGVDGLSGFGDIFYRNVSSSGVIPQISVVMGPCAGGASYSPALSDFVFMTKYTGRMYITGPAVVKSVIGEEVTSDELGGSAVHYEKSGVAHFVYDDDEACLNGVRNLLGYLPQNNSETPPVFNGLPVDNCRSLADIVPGDSRKAYDVRNVIDTFADSGSFLEIQPLFASNMVIGFARLDGNTVGIVANQSNYMAGSIDINASDKASRFIRFCDAFNIPILTLVDVPAYIPGKAQEHNGIIRHGAKLLYAYAESRVPKVTLILRKAYGGAFIAMGSKGLGADVVYAWPVAEIAVMGASGAVSIICKKQIESSENPENTSRILRDEYNSRFLNPYISAEHGYVDEVIFPEETGIKIKSAFEMLRNKLKITSNKKHGNIPL